MAAGVGWGPQPTSMGVVMVMAVVMTVVMAVVMVVIMAVVMTVVMAVVMTVVMVVVMTVIMVVVMVVVMAVVVMVMVVAVMVMAARMLLRKSRQRPRAGGCTSILPTCHWWELPARALPPVMIVVPCQVAAAAAVAVTAGLWAVVRPRPSSLLQGHGRHDGWHGQHGGHGEHRRGRHQESVSVPPHHAARPARLPAQHLLHASPHPLAGLRQFTRHHERRHHERRQYQRVQHERRQHQRVQHERRQRQRVPQLPRVTSSVPRPTTTTTTRCSAPPRQ